MNDSVRLSIDSTRLNVKEEENVSTEVQVKEHKVKDKSRRRSQREKNNSTVINKVIEDLLKLDNKCLSEFRDNVFLQEGSEEFIELISVFYQHHGLILEFAEWAIQQEVEATKDHLVLFREDSYTITLINTILFGDLGRRFLNVLIRPLIEDIISVGSVLDISEDRVGQEKAEANIKLLFKFVDKFLETFQESPHLCPITLREVFSIIKRIVEKKFGTSKFEAPFILDFIFFKYICPAIIDPRKYELVDDLPAFASRGLILASKLLNDIAHNLPKNRGGIVEDMWDSYITQKHPLLLQTHEVLLYDKNIALVKSIIKASVLTDDAWLLEQKASSAQKVRRFLRTLPQFYSGTSVSIYKIDSNEMFEIKSKEFVEKVHDPAWKKAKQTKDYTVYRIKDKDTMLLKVKAECTLDAPALTVFDFFKDFASEKKINSMIQDYSVISDSTRDDYQELHIFQKMPFPLNNRDLVISKRHYVFHKHDHISEDDPIPSRQEKHKFCSAAVVYESIDNAPREKGYVRGTMYVNGWYFEPLNFNSCRVTVVSHTDPGGSIPLWVVNYMTVVQTEKILLLKKMFEPSARKYSKNKKKSASMNDLQSVLQQN